MTINENDDNEDMQWLDAIEGLSTLRDHCHTAPMEIQKNVQALVFEQPNVVQEIITHFKKSLCYLSSSSSAAARAVSISAVIQNDQEESSLEPSGIERVRHIICFLFQAGT